MGLSWGLNAGSIITPVVVGIHHLLPKSLEVTVQGAKSTKAQRFMTHVRSYSGEPLIEQLPQDLEPMFKGYGELREFSVKQG
jgi:hypothetical protein